MLYIEGIPLFNIGWVHSYIPTQLLGNLYKSLVAAPTWVYVPGKPEMPVMLVNRSVLGNGHIH